MFREVSKKDEPNFVLTLSMITNDLNNLRLDKVFEVSRKIQNACLGEILRRDQLVQNNKQYRKNMRCIKAINGKKQKSKDEKEVKVLEKNAVLYITSKKNWKFRWD
jgi:hypothetical protein